MHCTNPECPDKKHYGVHGEYREGITVCPKCSEPLSESSQDEPGSDPARAARAGSTSPIDPDATLETVFTAGDPILIGIVKSLLVGADIEFYAYNDQLQELFAAGRIGTGFNPVVGPVEIRVATKDAGRARELLDQASCSETADA